MPKKKKNTTKPHICKLKANKTETANWISQFEIFNVFTKKLAIIQFWAARVKNNNWLIFKKI